MTFRSAASTTGGGSVTATAPAGYVSGDILVAVISGDDGAATLGFPAGWTKVSTDHITNGDTQTAAWGWVVATGTDSFAFTASNGDCSISIGAYSGRSATPIDVTPSTNNPNSASPASSPITATGTGITPIDSGCDIVLLAAWDSNNAASGTYSAGGSLTVRTSTTGTNFDPVALADFNQAVAAATGSQTMTRTASGDAGNFIAYLIALQPAGGGFTNSASIAWVS